MPASSTSRKNVTVSIVSHGQQALIAPLLEQIDRYCADTVAKLVLTVNTPEPEGCNDMALSFPIERIVNTLPRGFGANHNAAFERSESEWFLVLNPDIRLECDVLVTLLHQAQVDTGVLTPRIVEAGKSIAEPHRALITPLEIIRRHRPGYRPPAHPAWIPGTFMLFRAAAFQQIAGFDDRYFMYGEDFDICARLRLAGWHILVGETLQVRHEAQRASHRSWKHLRWHFSSLLRVWRSSAFWRYRSSQFNS